MTSVSQYAVFGNPIAHSRSPEIHQLFAAQEGVEIEYGRRLADIGGFAPAVRAFLLRAARGRMLPCRLKPKPSRWRTSCPNAPQRQVRPIR